MIVRPSGPVLIAVSLYMLAAGCGDDGPTAPDAAKLQELVDRFGLTPVPELEYPPYNLYNPDRVLLGRLLFFDPILSGEAAPWIKVAAGKDPYRYRANDVACGSCHHPDFAFADGRRLGSGVGGASDDGTLLGPARLLTGISLITGLELGIEPRNSPTVFNTAFNGKNSPEPVSESFQFMDGRVANGLEAQAQEPITDREEMAGDAYGRDILGDAISLDAIRDSVVARVRDIPGYVTRFQTAFPGEISLASDIRLNHINEAISAYERELVTRDSRYDRFVAGDFGVFSERERRGFEIFFGKGLCGDCHHGPLLSDFSFHVQGIADDYDAIFTGYGGKDGMGHDFGRFHANPQDFADQKYAFRTVTIREVAGTAPYFHSGSAATLEEVVGFYDRGGQGSMDLSDADLAAVGAVRDSSIQPLGLTREEKAALVAFMKTATGTVPPGPGGIDLTEVPARVPSGLLPPGMATPPGPGPFLP